MAASSINNDYVHQLLELIVKNKNVCVKYKVVNLSSFERNFKTFNMKSLISLKNFHPDIVIFQLGDNVKSNLQNIKEFFPYFVELVGQFPKSSKIITTPFFANEEKNIIAREVAIETNSYLVDLSNLSLVTKKNRANYEKNYKNYGIGIHPGDYGMISIAKNIFSIINMLVVDNHTLSYP